VRETPAPQRETVREAARQLKQLLRRRDQLPLSSWLARWQAASGPLHTPWKTASQWELEIESYVSSGHSTGPAEALNRRTALLRRQACGYTNLSDFTRRITLLNCALHPQG
jgi:transposase